MYEIVKTAHYTLMILLLVILLYTVGRSILLKSKGTPFGNTEEKLTLISLILAHTQLLLGFVLYFTGPWFGQLSNMGEIMKDSYQRLMVVEHPTTMIIAIVLLTIGRAQIKRLTDSDARFKKVFIFFGLALLLIVLRIPWQYIN
jgi:hypothetical protein